MKKTFRFSSSENPTNKKVVTLIITWEEIVPMLPSYKNTNTFFRKEKTNTFYVFFVVHPPVCIGLKVSKKNHIFSPESFVGVS